jgi:hypothetical protein
VYRYGWFNLWNSLDVATYVLQASIGTCHLMRFSLAGSSFSILIAAQHVLLWSKIHYYARSA